MFLDKFGICVTEAIQISLTRNFQLSISKNDSFAFFSFHYMQISNQNNKMLFFASSRRHIAKQMTPANS